MGMEYQKLETYLENSKRIVVKSVQDRVDGFGEKYRKVTDLADYMPQVRNPGLYGSILKSTLLRSTTSGKLETDLGDQSRANE